MYAIKIYSLLILYYVENNNRIVYIINWWFMESGILIKTKTNLKSKYNRSLL